MLEDGYTTSGKDEGDKVSVARDEDFAVLDVEEVVSDVKCAEDII